FHLLFSQQPGKQHLDDVSYAVDNNPTAARRFFCKAHDSFDGAVEQPRVLTLKKGGSTQSPQVTQKECVRDSPRSHRRADAHLLLTSLKVTRLRPRRHQPTGNSI